MFQGTVLSFDLFPDYDKIQIAEPSFNTWNAPASHDTSKQIQVTSELKNKTKSPQGCR